MDNHPPRHEPSADQPRITPPGSQPIGPDATTIGGLAPEILEARRARRASEAPASSLFGSGSERPTQPMIHVPDMPPGDPAPDAPPPPRERALKLADDLIHGSRRIRLAACEDMARYILAQAALDDVLELDAPTAANITDHEILSLARTYRDGSAADGERRQMCILALGVGPPVTSAGVLSPDLIAQARAWAAVQIHERSQMASVGAGPDPIDGPDRHRAVRNRSRRAREMSGLTIRQAARRLGITPDALVMLEASPVLATYVHTALWGRRDDVIDEMSRLYTVSTAWLVGDTPLRAYATVDSTPDAWRLTPRDRDQLAELAAAQPPRPVGAEPGPVAAIALALAVEYDGVSLAALLVLAERDRIPGSSLLTPRQRAAVDAWLVGRCCRRDHDRDGSCYLHPGAAPTAVCGMMCDGPDGACAREPGHPPAVVAPRIWTPRDDGTCGVCGLTEGEHIEIRAEVTRGVMHCHAVAP